MKEDPSSKVTEQDIDALIRDYGKPLPKEVNDRVWQKIKAQTIDLAKQPKSKTVDKIKKDRGHEREI